MVECSVCKSTKIGLDRNIDHRKDCQFYEPPWPTAISDLKMLENNFTYHPPSPGQTERYEIIRATAKDFATLIFGFCPISREKSLALIKLEEVVMWANAAIARNEKE